MQYRVILTVHTDEQTPDAWPDVRIERGTTVSIIMDGTEEEILGRVIGMRYEQVHVE
jgi:hypothetical protein